MKKILDSEHTCRWLSFIWFYCL